MMLMMRMMMMMMMMNGCTQVHSIQPACTVCVHAVHVHVYWQYYYSGSNSAMCCAKDAANDTVAAFGVVHCCVLVQEGFPEWGDVVEHCRAAGTVTWHGLLTQPE
jgi:hypothetical protein